MWQLQLRTMSNAGVVCEHIQVAVRIRPSRASLNGDAGKSGMRMPGQADQSVRIASAPDNKAQVSP